MKLQNKKKLRHSIKTVLTASAISIAVAGQVWADDETKITFIHTGDFHGDFHPHVNGRGDAAGVLEGGLARLYTKVRSIRRSEDNTVHVHTGDTIHGSATVTLTKGDAMVQVMDQLGVDVATPGNWEFSFGVYRYLQFFGVDGDITDITDNSRMAVKIDPEADGLIPTYKTSFRKVTFADGSTGYNRWGMVAANVYENGTKPLDNGVESKGVGKLLTPPYRIIEKDGVKMGFIGCTTNRGPQVVSSNITTGVAFTNCKGEVKFPQNRPINWDLADAETIAANKGVEQNPDIPASAGGDKGHVTVGEIVKWTKHLREVEGVDIVAVMSEAGIAENIYAAENLGQGDADWNGPDIYFSSDMHEETNRAVVVTDPSGKKVIIIENSEDAAQVGELEIEVEDGNIKKWKYKAHDILPHIRENRRISDLIDEIDQDVADMIANGQAVNPYNGHKITQQLDEVIGSTDMTVERNRFSNEHDPADKVMPGVIEGTGHALITDAFRVLTNSEVGGIRGFRYTNSLLPGDNITWRDLYHWMPIGPMVAAADIPTTTSSEAAPTGDITDNRTNNRHFLGWPRSLQQEMELSGNSTMNPIIFKWGGGWVFNYSGVKFDFKATGRNFNKYGAALSARVTNMQLTGGDNDSSNDTDIDDSLGATVNYASYYYDADANRINRNKIVGPNDRAVVGDRIQILAKNGEAFDADLVMVNPQEYQDGTEANRIFPLDAVEVLARYINGDQIPVYNWDATAMEIAGVRHTAQGLNGDLVKDEFEFPRIQLVNDAGQPENTLVDCTAEFGSPCIEPFRGAELASDRTDFDGNAGNGNIPLPANYIKGVADTPAREGEF